MRTQPSSRPAGGSVRPPSDPNPLAGFSAPAPVAGFSAPAPVAVLPQGAAPVPASGRPPGRVKPVFVDRTGRRRRLAVLAGLGVGAGLLVSLGMLVLGLLAGGPVTVPGWPDARGEHAPEDPAVGRLGVDGSPSATPPDGSGRTGPPAEDPARPPGATSRPVPPPSPVPTATDRPGQGDLHRNPKATKPTTDPDKPGRPSRSSGDPG
ncbi:hypothetical protein I0C86_41930 [Plantactinospora sp. S1510]|uniref:Translation initiation factor IF-2 n=1 Tax=Plantactinospora alkalitolerans TaxID=2789879 RepID=A0ABS0HB84_9ACTN|nr:hypothetical protein [Plantactinospora alkalitolerans]MBF9135414.1 hypothetical protein [Plantactinospora alkalitolerans]